MSHVLNELCFTQQSFETSLRNRAMEFAEELERECAPKTLGGEKISADPRRAVVNAVGDMIVTLLLGALPSDAEKEDVAARDKMLEFYASTQPAFFESSSDFVQRFARYYCTVQK